MDGFEISIKKEFFKNVKSKQSGYKGVTHEKRNENGQYVYDTNFVSDFSFEKKAAMDAKNEMVMQWEKLMWQYQQALPTAKPGEKWVLMHKIFSLPN